jgi:hypothetical protein
MIHCVWALPVALIGPLIGAVGSVAGAAASLLAKPKPPPVPNVPAPPPPAQQPQGSQTSSQPQESPSFLAAATSPQQGQTIGGGQGKTLLGQ